MLKCGDLRSVAPRTILSYPGGARLDRGNGIDLWGRAMGRTSLAGSGDGIDSWGYVMGAHDWIREMGLICGDTPLGATLAGTRHGGARLDQGDGIDLWGPAMGCDTGWMWVMRLIYGGVPWGAQLDRAMELICGGEPWKRTTLARSG